MIKLGRKNINCKEKWFTVSIYILNPMGFSINHSRGGKCTKICFHWQKLVKSPKASFCFTPCFESTQFNPINWLRKGKKISSLGPCKHFTFIFRNKRLFFKNCRCEGTNIESLPWTVLHLTPLECPWSKTNWMKKHKPCSFRYSKAYYSWKWVKYYSHQAYYNREEIQLRLKCKSNLIIASRSKAVLFFHMGPHLTYTLKRSLSFQFKLLVRTMKVFTCEKKNLKYKRVLNFVHYFHAEAKITMPPKVLLDFSFNIQPGSYT